MNLALPAAAFTADIDYAYELESCYEYEQGRVFLTGTKALVKLPLLQRAMDRRAGFNTEGFISGYRGSPLGGYDQELWRAKQWLAANRIHFQPAINEDLAATMVLGTQQVETNPNRTVDGVFSIWYGKGPGVDRSGDALKHGNAYGSSPRGGVLVVTGDDHGCVSSSMPHQSDVALMSWFMPTLNPANVAEYLEFGLYGLALSRFSGMWVGFKAISETVESAASVPLGPLPEFVIPDDYTPPPGGLHYRWPDFPGPQIEQRMEAKVAAVQAFARANPIDRRIYNLPEARFGIITTGKGHLDLMEALRLLGIDEARARELGIDIYKVGMVWPLQKSEVVKFLQGKQEVLVVEEKRGIIESEMKEYLYDYHGPKPGYMVGKYDQQGQPLVPWIGELSPSLLAPIVASELEKVFPGLSFKDRLARLAEQGVAEPPFAGSVRRPYFCSGCPHNASTRVPEGSTALAGIGCHFMASWMERNTESLIQMGGEGVNWAGLSPFIGHRHVFQNLGEGTWFHSGSMAIRQAQAAGINITYKILFNDAVAMTGGQPVDGEITVPNIAQSAWAEGVQRIAVVSDEPEKYRDKSLFPSATTFHHRDELDAVQRELRDTQGVTVLIYDQMCATEKRRRRKRGTFPKDRRKLFINEYVCEGCGDCSVQSNCLSVVPLETPFGRKRKIDQSSCNQDFSCLKGFCPSFVTVEGGELAKAKPKLPETLSQRLESLPQPELTRLDSSYDLLVTGVGGTGIVTIGAIITMAAHLEGKGASVLDFMGFAQKGGAVLSYVRLAPGPEKLNQVRIDQGQADAMICCDLVVGTSEKALVTLDRGRSAIVANATEIPTADNVLHRDATLDGEARLEKLRQVGDAGRFLSLRANALAERLLGDSIYSNMIMFGAAWQRGLVPLQLAAIERAIELNGVAIERNQTAFNMGRLAAIDMPVLTQQLAPVIDFPKTLEAVVARRVEWLTAYQNAAYAQRYRDFVVRVQQTEQAVRSDRQALSLAVAYNYFKLMAYKDEYEVARLYTDSDFLTRLKNDMSGDYKLTFNLAPPLLSWRKDAAGRPKKMRFGSWMLSVFKWLARLRGLRGTPFDVFGYSAERRTERRLIEDYREMIEDLLPRLTAENLQSAVAIAEAANQIRGYGPVKEQAIAEYRRTIAERLAQFDSPADARRVA